MIVLSFRLALDMSESRVKNSIDFTSKAIKILLRVMVQYTGENDTLRSQFVNVAEDMIKRYPYQLDELSKDEHERKQECILTPL